MKKILSAAAGILLTVSVFAASGDVFTIDLQSDSLKAVGADLQAAFDSKKEAAVPAPEQNQKDDAALAFKNAEKALTILIESTPKYAGTLKDIKAAHKKLYKSCGELVKEKGYGNDPVVISELVKLINDLKEEDVAKAAAKIVDHQYWNGVYERSQNISQIYSVSDAPADDFVKTYLKTGGLLSNTYKEGIDEEWNNYISLWLESNQK